MSRLWRLRLQIEEIISGLTMNIPTELIEQFAQENGALFLGAGISIGAGLPGWGELTDSLVADLDNCPSNSSYPDIAQYYCLEHGRNRLITRIKNALETYNARPTIIHSLLVKLGVPLIFTTNFDDLIERSLRNNNVKFDIIISSIDVTFWTTKRVQLIKLHGDFSHSESIVISSSDYEKYFAKHPALTRILSIALQTKTVLLLGYSATDINFKFILNQVQSESGVYARKAYAVMFDTPKIVIKDLESRGIKVINLISSNTDTHDIASQRTNQLKMWLEKLIRETKSLKTIDNQALKNNDNLPLPPEPYKFLNYFAEADSPIFHGREYEIEFLSGLVMSHQVIVLYGESGTGKTSLIKAGLLPRIRNNAEFEYLYFRPKADIGKEMFEAISNRFGIYCDNIRTFEENIEILVPENKTLLLIIDQFEELFIRQDVEARQKYLQDLVNLLLLYPLKVKFLFSIRSDYIDKLDYFEELGIQDPLRFRIRLHNFGPTAASIAISKPAKDFDITIETNLIEKLIGDLEQGGISPSQLQIVCYVLWQDWSKKGKHKEGITLQQYYRLGSTHGILSEYLNNVIKEIKEEKLRNAYSLNLNGDQIEAAIKFILKTMITSEQTKLIISGKEIAHKEIISKLNIQQSQVEILINYLQDRRIIRMLPESEAYELVHEVLIRQIWGWVSEDEKRLFETQNMLANAVSDYRRFNHLLSREKLELLNSLRDKLTFSIEQLELIFRSSMRQGYNIPHWFKRAKAAKIKVDKIVLSDLNIPNFRARAAGIATLINFGNEFLPEIIQMLNDDYPQVRVSAIAVLEYLQPSGEWRSNLKYERYIPAGKFVMGSEGEKNARPAHELYLEAYYIGTYPVTNTDYKRYLDANFQPFEIPEGKGNHPVVSISWYDARDYGRWANMRLLTEAEWEKAASYDAILPNKKRDYPWGNRFDLKKCNTKENGINATTPVGCYSPDGDSSYQVADLAGNVWEWTSSLSKKYPYRADDGREDPLAQGSRVLRGGSYHYQAQRASTFFRLDDFPYSRSGYGGFRVGFSIAANTITKILQDGR